MIERNGSVVYFENCTDNVKERAEEIMNSIESSGSTALVQIPEIEDDTETRIADIETLIADLIGGAV